MYSGVDCALGRLLQSYPTKVQWVVPLGVFIRSYSIEVHVKWAARPVGVFVKYVGYYPCLLNVFPLVPVRDINLTTIVLQLHFFNLCRLWRRGGGGGGGDGVCTHMVRIMRMWGMCM